MNRLLLTGLDGSNPLGFFAALGCFLAFHERVADANVGAPRLLWVEEDAWRPALQSERAFSKSDLVQVLLADLKGWADEPACQLRYQKADAKKKTGAKKWAHDLKPSPGHFREFASRIAERTRPKDRRSADTIAFFGSEVVQDETGKKGQKGNLKPTAFHFTAGQQEFLGMVVELAGEVGEDELREALFGPWTYTRELPEMRWDATVSRDYALRASDPSGDKKLGVPGADWLAFRGLRFFPVAPASDRRKKAKLQTTGCRGGWKDSRFRWPLWTLPLSLAEIRVAVGLDWFELDASERAARGIGAVLESAITRSDPGGYGNFSPPTHC